MIDEYKKYLRDCFQNFHDYFENIVSFILQERKIWLVIMEWSLKIGNNLWKPGEWGGNVSEKEKEPDVNTSNDIIANFICPRLQVNITVLILSIMHFWSKFPSWHLLCVFLVLCFTKCFLTMYFRFLQNFTILRNVPL